MEMYRVALPGKHVGERVLHGFVFVDGVVENVPGDSFAIGDFKDWGCDITPMPKPKAAPTAAPKRTSRAKPKAS